jgi:putative transposase
MGDCCSVGAFALTEKNRVHCVRRSERRELIDWEHRELSGKTQAQVLSLTRSGLSDQPIPPSAEEVAFKHRIDAISTQHPYSGYRKIAEQWHREGHAITQKTVAPSMREMGVGAISPGPNVSTRAHQAAVSPYLLKKVTAKTPNHMWGLDITSIRLRGGWMSLVALLDGYSRSLGSWELEQNMQIECVIEAMQRALSQATPQICNSGQGSHFTRSQSTQRLLAHDVRISMDSNGRALDTIVTERWWRTVKDEEVSLNDYTSPREAREELRTYVRL